MRIPVVQNHAGARSVLKRATALLLEGREEEASRIADEWASGMKHDAAARLQPDGVRRRAARSA